MSKLDPSAEQVEKVTLDVWTSFVELPVETWGEGLGDPDGFLSFIEITGAWEGVIAVYCDAWLARTLAAAMFGMELGEVSEAEVVDAMAEVANMVGGHVKTMVAQPSVLSLPSAREGSRSAIEVVGAPWSTTCALRCDDAPFVVCVSRREAMATGLTLAA